MPVIRFLLNFRVSTSFLIVWIILSCFPGFISSAVVTLDSIQIFRTHEWLNAKPTVYFMCKEENETMLPDVKEVYVEYTFKGEESWQPLTELSNKKCKRCGFYEKDSFNSDDVFDEWEFCPSDFTSPNGKYIRSKDKEFNATFLCMQCIPLETGTASNHTSGSHNGGKGMHTVLVIIISVVVSTVSVIGIVAAYKYWQKKKREQDQARFLKLFEDGDDIEDELGLGTIV